MLKPLRKKLIKPAAPVLMNTSLGSICLNYQTRKLLLMLKLHIIYILFAFPLQKLLRKIIRGGSRTAATSKIEQFVIIVQLPAVNYYHKALHLGCCSSPRSTSDNLPLHTKKIIKLDATEQFQQNTHFIGNLLDDIINSALNILEKSSNKIEITKCHTNKMSAIVQQFTSYNTLTPVPKDVHIPIMKNHVSLYLLLTIITIFEN